jgi:hypothetical protein
MLGIVTDGRSYRPHLVRLKPRNLAPAGKRIALRGVLWASAWSPDRRRRALAVSGRGRVQVVAVARLRDEGVIDLGSRTATPLLSWPRADRIVAVEGSWRPAARGWVLDPRTRQVVRGFRIPGTAIDGVVTASGLALLVGRQDRIADARLLLVRDDGTMKTVALPGVHVGSTPMGADGAPGREVRPAIAADPLSGRIYVADAERLRILEIDGTTVTEHDLTPPKGVFARVWDWLEAPAYAKGAIGPSRRLVVVARDLLALGGATERGGNVRNHDLLLIDTRTWTVRRVAERVGYWLPARDALLVMSSTGHDRGVTAYGFDGHRRWSRLAHRQILRADAARGRAYLSVWRPRHRTVIVATRTGRVLGRLPTAQPPIVLPGSPVGARTR